MAELSVEFRGSFAFVGLASLPISGIVLGRILLLKFLGLFLDTVATFTDFASRIHQISVVGDVVSVEDASCLVPGDDHGNLLRDAVADHIPDPGSPEIMKQQSLVFSLAPA